MSKQRTDEAPPKGGMAYQISIPVERTENVMFIRQAIAAAEGGGVKVEIAANIGGGCVLVTVSREGVPGWVTYILRPNAIADAILELDGGG